MNDQVITHDSFEALLSWLGTSRDDGARKYELIRARLIRIFMVKGCTDPEDLADTTINRVIGKLSTITTDYVGDPANYFCGVARLVYYESRRRKELTIAPEPITPAADLAHDQARQCLRSCLAQLPAQQRGLALDYYVDEKSKKIKSRQELASELGLTVNALRIRAHRIRAILEKCVKECIAAA
ncbi:MAG TPA: sigma-70 family RNA polymerase sigma factor [Pyrinomonadaceae bacterium]|nr:sigma-70 family RNA polymerase sigma factor [Pyrinomonadaceae bacterium]